MKKYPILYIFKQTRDDGKELKYSIRSLKNLKDWDGEVYISGDLPKWITGVTHIKSRVRSSNKMKDAEENMIAALKDDRLPEEFILCNDDFYVTKPAKLNQFHRGVLDGDRQVTYYQRAKERTRLYLQKQGIEEPLDYDIHVPMFMTKTNRREVSLLVGSSFTPVPLLPRSIYGNMFYDMPVKIEDKKTKTHQLPKGTFISTEYYTDELDKLFPEKSRFEI